MTRTTFAFLLIIGFALSNTAQAIKEEPTEKSTVNEQGKALHDASCLSCHTSKYPDDPNKMYSREDRTIEDYKTLASRVQLCGTRAVETSWFDDEFEAVITYLNTEFYHFEQNDELN